MSMEDVVLVASVREEIRDGAFRVDMADIPYHIEMVLAGRLIPPVDSKVYWDEPKSGTTRQGSVSTMASVTDPNVATMRCLVAQTAKDFSDVEAGAYKMPEATIRAVIGADTKAEKATAETRKADVSGKRRAAPRTMAEAAAKDKAEAEAERAKLEAEAIAKVMAWGKRETGVKAKCEADEKAKTMAKAKREADTQAAREVEAKAKRGADAKAKEAQEAKARAEAEAEKERMSPW